MMLLTRSLLVAVTIASQPANLGVLTIGETDVIARLSDTDIAVIKERVRNTCATLWLVKALRSQMADEQHVQVFCAPTPPGDPGIRVRRGTLVNVQRRPAETWTVLRRELYAQVVDDTTAAGQLPAGDRDIHRPFRLYGSLSDADLVSLVTFVRSSPPNPKPDQYQPRVEGGWPIVALWVKPEGIMEVGLAKEDMSGQRVELRKTGHGWEVVSMHFWVV